MLDILAITGPIYLCIAAGFASVDYAELADSRSLAPLGALGKTPARLLVAARIGNTRLIDNMAVNAPA